MPHVGNKKFAYTKAGRKEAEEYSKKTGQKVQNQKPPKKRGK